MYLCNLKMPLYDEANLRFATSSVVLTEKICEDANMPHIFPELQTGITPLNAFSLHSRLDVVPRVTRVIRGSREKNGEK